MSRILEGLNDQQKEAVTHLEGPLLILAGAGSGKTKVITHRVAHLLEQESIKPWNLFVVTFTNKAAGEMKDRVEKILGHIKIPWIGTFHSMCARILRREIEVTGQSSDFSILDKPEQLSLIRECYRDLNIDEKLLTPQKALRSIGFAKCQLNDVSKFTRMAHNPNQKLIARIYKQYESKLKTHNGLDFDDLISKTVFLFKKHPEVLEKYQQQFMHVLVDEYQDVNYAQYMLTKQLSDFHKNICVVGDDDQSIYGFRGADVSLILRFEKDFKNARIIKLEENYRSTGIILEAANSVVNKNQDRKSKKLWTKKTEGEKITIKRCIDAREEARYIAGIIDRMCKDKENKRYFHEFAILYRTNAQSRALEEMITQMGIQYQIVGGLRFYDRKEIKDITAYIKLIVNPRDYLSFRRIINTPSRGIGNVTQNKIISESVRTGKTLLQIMKNASSLPRVGKKIQDTLSEFATIVELLSEERHTRKLSDFVSTVIEEVGYKKMLLEENDAESMDRLNNLDEFINQAAEFAMLNSEATLESFLEKIALFADIDEREDDTPDFKPHHIMDWKALFKKLKETKEGPENAIFSRFDEEAKKAVINQGPRKPVEPETRELALTSLNRILPDRELYSSEIFKGLKLQSSGKKLLNKGPAKLEPREVEFLNRYLIEAVFSNEMGSLHNDRVTMMTLHSAKGLEFPIVFIAGLEENLLPHIRSLEEGKEAMLEEERRLFYVGITRAISKLYLTYAEERTVHGKTHNQSPSRFLQEIPEDLLDSYVPEVSKRSFARKASPLLDRRVVKTHKSARFSEGDGVYHKIFGQGEVISVSGSFVTAEFPGVGKKTLSEDFLSPGGKTGDKKSMFKPGDRIRLDDGTKGILKKLEGDFAYIILEGPRVEKVEMEKVKAAT